MYLLDTISTNALVAGESGKTSKNDLPSSQHFPTAEQQRGRSTTSIQLQNSIIKALNIVLHPWVSTSCCYLSVDVAMMLTVGRKQAERRTKEMKANVYQSDSMKSTLRAISRTGTFVTGRLAV